MGGMLTIRGGVAAYSLVAILLALIFSVHQYICLLEANTNNLYVLFLMAIVCDQLPWDLAVTCAISSSSGMTIISMLSIY